MTSPIPCEMEGMSIGRVSAGIKMFLKGMAVFDTHQESASASRIEISVAVAVTRTDRRITSPKTGVNSRF